jgi:hypothetical protein
MFAGRLDLHKVRDGHHFAGRFKYLKSQNFRPLKYGNWVIASLTCPELSLCVSFEACFSSWRRTRQSTFRNPIVLSGNCIQTRMC